MPSFVLKAYSREPVYRWVAVHNIFQFVLLLV